MPLRSGQKQRLKLRGFSSFAVQIKQQGSCCDFLSGRLTTGPKAIRGTLWDAWPRGAERKENVWQHSTFYFPFFSIHSKTFLRSFIRAILKHSCRSQGHSATSLSPTAVHADQMKNSSLQRNKCTCPPYPFSCNHFRSCK